MDCCQHNIALKGLSHFVSCEKGDAGKITRRLMRSQTKPDTTVADNATDVASAAPPPFGVLLVDPPRQGLDEQVIKLVTTSNNKNLLYVSCGRHALKRATWPCSTKTPISSSTVPDLAQRDYKAGGSEVSGTAQ